MVATHELTVDERLQRDVLETLYRDPEVTSANMGVEVEDGIVTLTGTVESLDEGLAAECTALQVDGVRRIKNDIDVQPVRAHAPSDAEVCRAVAAALEWDVPGSDRIKVSVCNGSILLEGTVDQEYQKRVAEPVVLRVTGVHTVLNFIEVEHSENKVAWTMPSGNVVENSIGTVP